MTPDEAKILVQTSNPTQTPMGFDMLAAEDIEKIGFEALSNKDFKLAVEAFEATYKKFPMLHNVDEIRSLLNRRIEPMQAAARKNHKTKD